MVNRDICIIGGGIAGALTALFLAKHYEMPCTLIDKSVFPREKICGDGCSGWVVSVLQELDQAILEELMGLSFLLPSYGMRISAPNGKFLDLPFQNNAGNSPLVPPGFVAQRYELDNFLMNKAAANPLVECMEGCEVTGFNISDDGIRLMLNSGTTQIHAKLVVFAQGTGSLKPPVTNSRKPIDNSFIGLRGYYRNVQGFHRNNFIELHFLKPLLPGYFWMFPMAGNMANVGVGMLKNQIVRRKVSLKAEFNNVLEKTPGLRERFVGATPEGALKAAAIPVWSRRESISGNRFMTLGDAARLVDPITGEGMGHAALSAKYAAATASLAFSRKRFDASFMKHYDDALYQVIGKELLISRRISRLIKRPLLLNMFMKKAERNPELKDILSGSISDLNKRAQLNHPLFFLKLLFG